jgi:Arc/MetJ family transcription regulator
MKTTIDIPESELQEAIRHTGAKTKREAVLSALRDFNRRQRLAALTGILGTFEDFMTPDDLREMRQDSAWRRRGSR